MFRHAATPIHLLPYAMRHSLSGQTGTLDSAAMANKLSRSPAPNDALPTKKRAADNDAPITKKRRKQEQVKTRAPVHVNLLSDAEDEDVKPSLSKIKKEVAEAVKPRQTAKEVDKEISEDVKPCKMVKKVDKEMSEAGEPRKMVKKVDEEMQDAAEPCKTIKKELALTKPYEASQSQVDQAKPGSRTKRLDESNQKTDESVFEGQQALPIEVPSQSQSQPSQKQQQSQSGKYGQAGDLDNARGFGIPDPSQEQAGRLRRYRRLYELIEEIKPKVVIDKHRYWIAVVDGDKRVTAGNADRSVIWMKANRYMTVKTVIRIYDTYTCSDKSVLLLGSERVKRSTTMHEIDLLDNKLIVFRRFDRRDLFVHAKRLSDGLIEKISVSNKSGQQVVVIDDQK